NRRVLPQFVGQSAPGGRVRGGMGTGASQPRSNRGHRRTLLGHSRLETTAPYMRVARVGLRPSIVHSNILAPSTAGDFGGDDAGVVAHLLKYADAKLTTVLASTPPKDRQACL